MAIPMHLWEPVAFYQNDRSDYILHATYLWRKVCFDIFKF